MALLCITAAAAVVVLCVGPLGDFPLSDDWSYGHTARILCTTGRIEFLPWTGTSLVFQAWYGAALCRLFGFSFTLLRVSTLFLAVSGAVGFWLLLGRTGVRGPGRALGTTLFGLNPLFVNLSFTYMTDVPFTVAVVWAGYLYLRGLTDDDIRFSFAASIVCAAACLVRQHGIFPATAAALVAMAATDRPLRQRLAATAAAFAVPALVFVGFHLWLFLIHGPPAGVGNKLAEASVMSPLETANILFRAVEYLGFFLLPLAVLLAARVRPTLSAMLAAAGLFSAAGYLYFCQGALMPYLTNVVYDFGLGALTLRDTLFLGWRPVEHLGHMSSLVLTLASTAGAAALLGFATGSLRRFRDRGVAFLALAALLLLAGSLFHAGFYFDRYLLPVIPFTIAALLAARPPKRIGFAPALLAACLAFYAVAGTHDYMAWNRARYEGLDHLEATGVGAEQIDGGVEYNGWHLAAKLGTWPTKEQARPGQPASRKSWWWVVDDRFVVSFRPLSGYRLREELSYPRWLWPGKGAVLILERVTP